VTRIASRARGAFLLLVCLVMAVPSLSACSSSGKPAGAVSDPVPVLSYYYIWFDTQSWDRAKTDYPLL
jgi:hypothetical protein